MSEIGICEKCGKKKKLQSHHKNGYMGKNKDVVVLYCKSCDQKAHFKARKNGVCNLSTQESTRLSNNSYKRRNRRTVVVSDDVLIKNVLLREFIVVNTKTGTPICSTYLYANNGKKLFYIGE